MVWCGVLCVNRLQLWREDPKQTGSPEAGKAVADLLVDAPAAGPVVAAEFLRGRLPRVRLVFLALGGGLLALGLALALAGVGAGAARRPSSAGAVEVEIALFPALERTVFGVAPVPTDVYTLALVSRAEDEASPFAGGDTRCDLEHDVDKVRWWGEEDLAGLVDDRAGDAPDSLEPIVGPGGCVEPPRSARSEEVCCRWQW